MLRPLFAACTKTSHLFTIHPLRYYFFFFYSFHSIDLAIPVLVYTCRGLSGYFWLHLRPHKPTSARCLPAIYDCSSYKAKLPNCL